MSIHNNIYLMMENDIMNDNVKNHVILYLRLTQRYYLPQLKELSFEIKINIHLCLIIKS